MVQAQQNSENLDLYLEKERVLAQKGPGLGVCDCGVVLQFLGWIKLESFILWICNCNCLICNVSNCDIFNRIKFTWNKLGLSVSLMVPLLVKSGRRGET